MHVELINTGTELLLGQVLNRHQQWLGQKLAAHGLSVARQITVPDTGDAIEEALKESLSRSDLIITTGGLGPTSDDRTRDRIAAFLHRPLQPSEPVLQHIRDLFARRGRPMPEPIKVQALVPRGARILMNQAGTAPGLAFKVETRLSASRRRSSWLIMLPGPPRELHPMVETQVLPLLSELFPAIPPVYQVVIRSTGVGESTVAQEIEPHLILLQRRGLEIGYCARIGEVDIRLLARGNQAKEIVREARKAVLARMGDFVFAEGEEDLERVIVAGLTAGRHTLALAESCTGGLIAHRITQVPGASAVLNSGLVTYSNESKMRLLAVPEATLKNHGAVSEPTARAMAEGARTRSKVDYAIAVTGIAGPSGGNREKPVGTVFLALATPTTCSVKRLLNPYDRKTFKHVTSQQALEMLRRALRGIARVQ